MACNERLKNPHFKSAQNAYNNTAQTMAATATPVNVLGILNTDTGCSMTRTRADLSSDTVGYTASAMT